MQKQKTNKMLNVLRLIVCFSVIYIYIYIVIVY